MTRTQTACYTAWLALVTIAALALLLTLNPAWLIAFTAALVAPWLVALVAM